MKIINCCLFSEIHEANVLEVKLNCENEGVDEWIFIQSPYSFRGEYKGVCLQDLLNESRFDLFRDRITIHTIEENLFEKVGKEHAEKGYFQVEHASRMYCNNYIMKYPDDTRVIVSDVDELIDFSRADRRDRFFEICRQTDKDIQLWQPKYWFNFNNLACYPKYLPVRTIGSLKNNGWPYFRNDHCESIKEDLILSFEYSYCFDLQGNMRKCETFSHDRYKEEHLKRAFLLNTWHKRDHEQLSQAWDFFETIELTPENSPTFVLENFDRLDTKTIDPDYANNRVNMLGMRSPHPCESNGMLGSNKIDRRYHYLRRS